MVLSFLRMSCSVKPMVSPSAGARVRPASVTEPVENAIPGVGAEAGSAPRALARIRTRFRLIVDRELGIGLGSESGWAGASSV
jgi:hypothetical protein